MNPLVDEWIAKAEGILAQRNANYRMLTSKHLIVEFNAGRSIPDRLQQSTNRHYIEYAEKMLYIYCNSIGQQHCRLYHQIESLFANESHCPVRRIQTFCTPLDNKKHFSV